MEWCVLGFAVSCVSAAASVACLWLLLVAGSRGRKGEKKWPLMTDYQKEVGRG